jgi:hypothetical protein
MKSANCARIGLALVTLAAIPANAQAPRRICVAPASAETVVGHAADLSAAVRDSMAIFLTGPDTVVTPLSAQLFSQAREEARRAGCPFVLYPSVRHERKGGGTFGRIVADAVQGGVRTAAAAAPSAASRVAESAVSAVAANVAVAREIKPRDTLDLHYRFESADGRVLVDKHEKRKARAEGEDLVTPLARTAVETILSSLSGESRGKP